MTEQEQRTYWLKYAKQNAKMERLAYGIVLDLFRDRLSAIYAYLEAYGLPATLDQLDILFTKLHVQDMYTKLYMQVGTRQKEWADADVRARFLRRKASMVSESALLFKDEEDDRIRRRPNPVTIQDITPTFGVGFFNDQWLARLRNLYTGSEVGKRVTSVTKTIKNKIRESLTESSQTFVSISKTITKLKRDVGRIFARQRAELIARTEVTYVNNLAAEQSAKETAQSVGLDLVKVWIRTLDDRTRDSHWNAPMKPIKAEDKFKIGPKKKLMDKPGDPAGGLEEIINCRCVVSYMPADDHEDLLNEDGEFQSVPRRLSLEEQADAFADAAMNDPEFLRQLR